jgi:hypothetical protein
MRGLGRRGGQKTAWSTRTPCCGDPLAVRKSGLRTFTGAHLAPDVHVSFGKIRVIRAQDSR